MRTSKKLLIVIISLFVTTLFMGLINKVDAFKLINRTGARELDKSVDKYYYMMYTAGTHSSGPDSGVSTLKSSNFAKFVFDEVSSWKGLTRRNLYNGTAHKWTDYYIFMLDSSINWRTLCIAENKGDSNFTPLDLDFAIFVNPNGDDGNEINYYSKKRDIDNPTKTINESDDNYLAQLSYLQANAPLRAYVEYFINRKSYGTNLNKQLKKFSSGAGGNIVPSSAEWSTSMFSDKTALNNSEKYRNFLKQFSNYTSSDTEGFKVSKGKTVSVVKHSGGKNVIGPYKISFPNYSASKATIKVKSGSSDISFTLTTNSGASLGWGTEVKSGQEFYIKVDDKYDADDIKVVITNSYTLYGSIMLFFSGSGSTIAQQNRLIYRPFKQTATDKLTLENKDKVKVTISFYKRAWDGTTKLKGAEISVAKKKEDSNVKKITKNLVKSDDDGKLRFCRNNSRGFDQRQILHKNQ